MYFNSLNIWSVGGGLHKTPVAYIHTSLLFFLPSQCTFGVMLSGYGPEDNHFVLELTYNYNISNYTLGNDFQVRD